MQTLKIKFVDFWFGFKPDNNYFFNLLSLKYQIELCDEPQILIYSCYGTDHIKYDCTRIFYTAENLRPDFLGCDFAISFDYNTNPRHYRLPLYALYIDKPGLTEKLIEKKTRERALEIWRSKKKFCCMVVSNGQSVTRLNFFKQLSKYKNVDSGGKILNNVGGPVADKIDFIKDYRFVISFENASSPGYTTEKITESFLADCIPLYWGNPLVEQEFNPDSFLNFKYIKSEAEMIRQVIAIDNSEEHAIKMLAEPKFTNGIIPNEIDKQNVTFFFDSIIYSSAHIIPVSRTWKKRIYFLKIRINGYKSKFNYYFNRIKIASKVFI
jgi:alpha(1,3/1,4) fucosyltransferase